MKISTNRQPYNVESGKQNEDKMAQKIKNITSRKQLLDTILTMDPSHEVAVEGAIIAIDEDGGTREFYVYRGHNVPFVTQDANEVVINFFAPIL